VDMGLGDVHRKGGDLASELVDEFVWVIWCLVSIWACYARSGVLSGSKE
jgi:hypothetical protein